MNRTLLVGRLTKDPELRYTNSGVPVVAFTVAVNRTYTSSNGEREADFINCICFNKQAENLNRYIRKGGLVGVDGRIQTRSYKAQDGSNRYVTEVVCENIHFLEPKGNSQNNNNVDGNFDYSPYDMPRQPSQNYESNGLNTPPGFGSEIVNQTTITDDDLSF